MKHNLTGIKTVIGLSSALIINTTGSFAQNRDAWEDSLALIVQNSRTMQLPLETLENKIKEGRAKNRPASEIYSAVKNRQKLLLHIRDNQNGIIPHGYTKQLFDLERSNSPLVKTIEHRVDTTVTKKSPQPQAPTKAMSLKVRERIDTSSGKKIAGSPANTGKGNGNAQQMNRKMQKANEKAQKAMNKAESHAERRMEAIQKRLQKKAMKRRGIAN